MGMARARGLICAFAAAMLVESGASAEPTISGSVDEIESWAVAHAPPPECTESCFVLERLALRGNPMAGSLRFELAGSVVAGGARNIPLFGDPTAVRLADARLNGGPATIGFDTSWFLRTDARHFTLTGTIVLGEVRELSVPGPLNAFDADLASGYVVEGAHLSGLTDTVLHFEAGEVPAAEPPPAETFDLARAIRVGDRIAFEYHLKMSGLRELGVQRLPLKNGEQVMRVDGSVGWSVENAELVLRTSGRDATVVVHGLLSGLGTFTADARSPSEWMLLESDIDHEIRVQGDATPADVAQSPIGATAPIARAFRLMPREHLDIVAARRESRDVLAAVVDSHERVLLLTAQGDMVMNDLLQVDDSALDVVRIDTHARPIFLAVDGVAERILQEAEPSSSDTVAVPLRAGRHWVRLQSVGSAPIGWPFGRLRIPMPEHALTTGEARVTVCLPEGVQPIATTGGDHPVWLAGDARDALALGFSSVVAWLAFGRRRTRVAAAAIGFGLWWLAQPLFIAAAIALAGFAAARWVALQWTGWSRRAGLLGVAIALAGMSVVAVRAARSEPDHVVKVSCDSDSVAPDQLYMTQKLMNAASERTSEAHYARAAASEARSFGTIGLLGGASLERGVTPVELPLPSAARSVAIERQLVTKDRPFVPTVWYVTSAVGWMLRVAWIAALAWMLWCHRATLARWRRAIRAESRLHHEVGEAPPPPARE
jgi:hypothetical protein